MNGDLQDYSEGGHGYLVQNLAGNAECVDLESNFLGSIKLDRDEFVLFNSPGRLRLFNAQTCATIEIANAPCLNLSGKIEGRYQYVNGKRHIYWIEENGPIRVLNIDECFPKKYPPCGDCPDEPTEELDCDATLLNTNTPHPCVDIKYDETGSIPNSVVQIAIAYYDDNVRASDYIIMPNLTRLHNDSTAGFSLRIKLLPCITSNFPRYELVLITHRIDRGTVAQSIGIFDNSQEEHTISTLDEARYAPIDYLSLLSVTPKYQSAKHIAVNDETLVLAGVKSIESYNYQPLANQIVSHWTVLRVQPKDAYKYPSFQRNEVYAFEIAWVYPDGSESPRFHIPNDANPNIRLEEASKYNNDPSNLWEADDCDPNPTYVWEVFDTSTLTFSQNLEPDCNPVIIAKGKFSYWESKDNTYPEHFGNLSCLPIRYHKFPKENAHAPFTHIVQGNDCEETYVNLMGVEFSNILPPVDCDNNLIPVQGYKVYVSDRTGQETILANGLFYNVREETLDSGVVSMFQNYPYNDLNPDVFLSSTKVKQGQNPSKLNAFRRDRFTFISPDTHFIKGRPGSEVQIYTEKTGRPKGEFHDTHLYPKYQILSPFGRTAAHTLGVMAAREVLLGQPCTTTSVEQRCRLVAQRVSTTDGVKLVKANISSPGGFLNGTGTITTTFSLEDGDYEVITQADPRCGPVGYMLTSLVYTLLSEDSVVSLLPDYVSDLCTIVITTNVPSSDPGVTLSIKLNNLVYTSPVINGKATFNLNGNCEKITSPVPPLDPSSKWTLADITEYEFSRRCECEGDEETATVKTTTDCDTKMKWLNSQEWFKRIPAMIAMYSNGYKGVKDFLTLLFSPTNYAVQQTSVANYCNTVNTSLKRRRIDFQQYLTPHKLYVNERRFNNWQQAPADYLELHATVPDPTTQDYTRFTLKDNNCDRHFSCLTINTKPVRAVSYYGSIIRELPNQYGKFDYQTKQITCVLQGSSTGNILGGDVYITKHHVMRRFPFFEALPLGLPNNTDFDLDQYFNIAKPTFWLNVNEEGAIEDVIEDLPLIGTYLLDYNLDLVARYEECIPGWFNNWTIAGAPAFLSTWLGSAVSGAFFNPFKLPGKFYTHVTGIAEYWAESKFIGNFREYNESVTSQTVKQQSLTELARADRFPEPELFLYNLQNHWQGLTKQTFTAKPDCCEYTGDDFRLIYSLKQTENSKSDQWRKFLPNNFTELPRHVGPLTVMKEIDENNLFFGFEDASYVTQQDEGLLTDGFNSVYLGTGNAFTRRLRRLSDDPTGFGGIIDKEAIVSTRYGLFWYDRKRRKFIHLTQGIGDITNTIQSWVDDYFDVPARMSFDPKNENLYVTGGGKGILFKPGIKNWVSFLDWDTDGYLQMSDNLISLKNNKAWKHNTDDYQRFFNQYRPFEVATILKSSLKQIQLQSLDVIAEFYIKQGNNKFYDTEVFFDEIWVHNQLYSTGKKPIIFADADNSYLNRLSTDVTVVHAEDFTYRINNLRINSTEQPIVRHTNGIIFNTGANNISEYKPLQGKYFQVHLKKSTGRHKVMMAVNLGLNNDQNLP